MAYVYKGTREDPPEKPDPAREAKRRNDAAYRERNRERIRAEAREWHAANKDRVNARRREKYLRANH